MTHILIADDDEAIRKSLSEVLAEHGYEVIEAQNGAEALRILRTYPASLVVLLDLIMPEPNGAKLMNLIANEQSLAARHAYIIITGQTLLAFPATRQIADHLGAEVMSKPFDDIETLIAAIVRAEARLTPPHDDLTPERTLP